MQYSDILKDIHRAKLSSKTVKKAYKMINETMERLEGSIKPTDRWQLYTRYGSIYGEGFTEAICPHGVGHHKGAHGCHSIDEDNPTVGCCFSCPKEIWDKVSKD